MPNLIGNKGEWSEFYTLIKLVVDKEIKGADQNLDPIPGHTYPILKVIISKDHPQETIYDLQEGSSVKITNSDKVLFIDSNDIKPKVRQIFTAIKNTTNSRSFTIPLAEPIYQALNCQRMQGINSDKSDITLLFRDINTQREQETGFSIKSKIGSPATLLNASGATNIVYKILNCDIDHEWERINQIESLGGKLEAINELGGDLSYIKIDNDTFTENLRMIDTVMPEIVGEMVKIYYLTKKTNTIEKIAHILTETNPLKAYSPDYTHKIKNLLKEAALGMQPSKKWNGEDRATGGYIIVKTDGEIVCYNAYLIKDFRDYLFKNTKMETGKRSKHHFGVLYKEGDSILIKLNLQIRFK